MYSKPQKHRANIGKTRSLSQNHEYIIGQANGQASSSSREALLGIGSHLDTDYYNFFELNSSLLQKLDDLGLAAVTDHSNTWTQPLNPKIDYEDHRNVTPNGPQYLDPILFNLRTSNNTSRTYNDAMSASYIETSFVANTPFRSHELHHTEYNNCLLDNNLNNYKQPCQVSSEIATYAPSIIDQSDSDGDGSQYHANVVNTQQDLLAAREDITHEATSFVAGEQSSVVCRCGRRLENNRASRCVC